MPVLAVAAVAFWPVDSHAQTNTAPVITSPGSKTYEQGETITPFAVTVSDADGDTVTVTVTGLPSGLSYGNGQVQGTVSADASAQSYTVTVGADDGVNSAVESTFTIAVTEAATVADPPSTPSNAAPVITSPGSKTYEQGETIAAFAITVSDADGDAVTVTVTGLPSGLSYGNGQVQGTVSADASAQSYTVTVSADDGVNSAVESTFTIAVTEAATVADPPNTPPNAAPVVTSPGSKTYEQGETITPFDVTVSDADGDTVTVTVAGLPSGLSYTNGQVQGTVSEDASAQSYTVTVGADDGVNSAVESTFTITVTAASTVVEPANTPPVITSPGDKSYEQGETITAFGVTVSDADGDPVTVTVTGLPSGLSYSNGQVQGTVSEDASAQSYTVTVGADDGVNSAVESTFTITVTAASTVVEPANTPPVITSPGDKSYEQGETITAFGVTVSDADGDAVTVTVTGLPSGLSYSNGEVQGTVSEDASAQSYTVTVGADDGVNSAVESTFTITVTAASTVVEPANTPPVITSPGDKTYKRGETITPFGITVSDADGDPVTVTVTGLPSGLSYSNGQVQGTVSDDASPEDHTVTILADDGGDAVAMRTFTIEVTALRSARSTAKVSYSFTRNIASVEEGKTLLLKVTQSGPGRNKFRYWTDVTQRGDAEPATPNADYPPVPGSRDSGGKTITFSGDGDDKIIQLNTHEDSEVEHDEIFVLRYSVPFDGGRILGVHTITILNDDQATFTVSDAQSTEGEDMDFTVTLNRALPRGVTLTPSYTNGTAAAGDYTANTNKLTFAGTAGEKKTFTVGTAQDSVLEEDETFTLGFTVPSTNPPWNYTGTGGAIAVVAGTGTIEDDDTPAVTIANASATEGDTITFTVTLDKAVSGGLTVTPSFTDDTATKGTDYTENTAALSFAGTAGETQTITVATTEDTDAELTESFVVSLAVSGTQTPVKATDTAQGIIQDDDGDLAEVTIEDASADEGDSMTFTVTLDRAVSGGLTVTPRFAGGTTPGYATEGTDFTANTAPLSFIGTAGEKKTFTVATIQDSVAEPDELFHVNLVVSGAQVPVTHTDFATGTIRDDEVRSLTVADASAVEGDSMTFTVTLGKAVTGGLTMAVGHTDGTALHGVDYRVNVTGPTFAGTAGETKTFTVETIGDDTEEEDETFTVRLLHTSGTQVDTATGTIVDNDGPPAVRVTDASATEGDSMTFTLTLDKAVPLGLTVTPTFTDGTATKGTDYTERGDSGIPFDGSAGATRTFTVSTTEDTDEEDDETFTVNLVVSGTSETVTATDTGTGTIVDDDGPAPALTVADASAVEGNALAFTVTLDKAVSGGLTVTPTFTDGTATKGTDYTENTAGVTFTGTAGETQSFTVSTADDVNDEDDETFTVSLAVSGTQQTVTATDTATGTIKDDDGPVLTIDDASAAEGDSISFTVTLDKAVSGGLTVTPSFTDGTATEGTDYTKNAAALTFTGTQGETQSFTVATTEDPNAEPDETFTVGLTVSGTSKTVTATDTATGTITNDDGALPVVTVADASVDEGGSMTFTVTLDAAVSGGLAVTPSFTDVTATKGTDYTENTAALNFTGTAGETQSFTVATTEDADAEPDETFTVGLSVSGTSKAVTATDTATGTITNDDGALANVTIGDASAAEGDSLTFTVTLDAAVSGGLTVTPSFTDVTATKGTDYTENTAGLSFAGTAGETQTFTVTTTEDAVAERDEVFTVGLALSGTQALVAATDRATGTITNDDGAPPAVTIADVSAAEGDSLTFTVTLDAAVSGGLTVTPSFTDVTATAGTDYTRNTAALSFTGTANETRTFTVATTEDSDTEPDETFTVNLTVSGNSAPVTATDTATGTITNDDGALPAVTIADGSAAEGDSMTFTVTLDKAVSGGLTVTPSFTDVTATKGTDYTANTAAMTFTGTAGETQSFIVATTEDTDEEDDETFTVGVAVSGNSAPVTAADTATGTILDDDGEGNQGVVTSLTVDDEVATEGDALTFTVTLNEVVSGGLTVTPSFTDVTATKGTDYTANTAAMTFTGTAGETHTLTVPTIGDTDEEDDETFTVSLTVSGSSETVTATDTATGTILDDDGGGNQGVVTSLTVDDEVAAEGDPLTFTVTLNAAVSGGLTVTPSFTDATATKGADYTANTAAISFAGNAGETRTFTVTTIGDTDEEDDETFAVGLRVSGTSETVTATDTATGTIIDDDAATAGTLTIGDATALEGDRVTFAVTLDRAVPHGFTVTPQLSDGTATSGDDYSPEDQTVRFAGTAGETQTFSVPTVEDAIEESDETFTVSLAVSGTTAAVAATDTAAGRIVDDDLTPVVLTVDVPRVSEAAGPTVVEVTAAFEGGVTLSRATAVQVTAGAAGDAAVAGTDYTASPASFTVTIPAGAAAGSSPFTLDPVNDTLMETDEALTVSGASGSRAVTGTAVTLEDDDTASARLVIRLEPDVVSEDSGPTQVSVIAEIVGATPTAPLPVTMQVGDQDDTAQLTMDYEPVDGFSVTIPAGATQQRTTFLLSPIDDDLIEGNETLTVTGEATRLDPASDQGLIRDEDLAEVRSEGTGRTLFLLARAIGSESLAAIEERFSGAGSGRRARLGAGAMPGTPAGAAGTFAGSGMAGTGPGLPGMAGAGRSGSLAGAVAHGQGAPGMGSTMAMHQHPFGELAWLDGAGFAAPLDTGPDAERTPAGSEVAGTDAARQEEADEAGWVVWGRAATTRTAVQATPGAQARGDLFTMHLGVDTRVGSGVLLGVAASHSEGKLGYTLGTQSDAMPAAVEGGLTSAQPYVHWAPRAGLELWGLGGAGRGALQVSDTFGTVDTGIGMRLAAGGVRQEVSAASGLAVKADAFHVAMASDAHPDLPAARATATRARMLLEWKSEWAAPAAARIRPRLELGGRWDGGSDVDGFGSEVGGGIALAHVGLGLELAGAGRYLLAHQAEGFEEWGASLALRAGPGVSRRGAWVSVEPEWGAAASRMHAMWGQQPDPALHPGAVGGISGAEPGRLLLAAGYTLPEAGADLRLEATRESYGPRPEPNLRVGLSATFNW